MTDTARQRARRRTVVAAAGVALVLLLAGCATPLLFAQNRPPAPVHESADICAPEAPTGGVPDRFVPVAAYLCDQILIVVPPDPDATPPTLEFDEHGRPSPPPSPEQPDAVPSEAPRMDPRRFEGDLIPLLAALSVPDVPSGIGDSVCPLVMVFPPDVRLVDDRGRWVRPAIPRNECGQPERDAVDEAFARLTEVD